MTKLTENQKENIKKRDAHRIAYKQVPAKAVIAADRILAAKDLPLWDFIAIVVDTWIGLNPVKYSSFVADVSEKRRTRRSAKKDVQAGGRFLIDIPQDIVYMIRRIYPPERLKMDKEFFRKFAKKFPQFKVIENV